MSALLLAGGRLPGSDATVDVLVRHGVIASVAPAGSASAVTAGAEVRALDGRWIIPGLWDNHVHFTQWTKVSRRLDLSRCGSAAEAATHVRDALAARSSTAADPREALVGYGFRDGLWPDLPTKHLLDAVAGDTPVLLVSGDLHCCWASSAALAPHGYGDHPTGLLREDDCFDFMYRVEEGDASSLDARAVEVARDAAARGVVGIVDLEIDWNPDRWQRLAALGHDALRVEFGVWPQHLERARDAGLRSGDVLPGTGGLVRVGPAKVVTDGSLNTRTAYCFDPYPDVDGEGGAAHGGVCGQLSVPPEELRELMLRAARQGLRPAIHAIGDHANRLALDAFAHLDRELRGAHRDAAGIAGSIEHAQLLTASDVQRFAELGVIASVQPEHAMDDRDVADVYWAGRTHRAFALADLRAAGTILALGSDAPVAPLDPWATLSAAVGRARDGRAPWHLEQAIDRATALDASVRTRVAAGERADLAVVDRDPLTASPDDLRAMRVSATLLGGRFTHDTLGG